ncbi:MAG: hypothetical protein IJB91_08345 [Oscillospiraceae bacterium]|nr:hypothetical protein [Oscillospiraceae bacterium]
MEKYFLPSTHDDTDRTPEIQALLETYGTCQLGSGIYVTTGITMPEGASLMGVGYATKLLLREDISAGYTVKLDSFCTVKDLAVMGARETITLPETVGDRHGLAFIGNATLTDWKNQIHNSIITGCYLFGFTGGGITCTDTGYHVRSSMAVSNCHIFNCGAGINISHYSEFHMFTNVQCTQNLYGCINNGGNNVFVNCGFNSNATGFLIDNSRGQSPNNAHGSVVGCTFNHTGGNGGIGIQILGAKPGYSFTGCQLFFSQIVLEDSYDILFDTLNTGRQVKILVKGGGLTMFTNCSFGHLPEEIRVEDNENVKFINCFAKTGEPVGN